MLLLMLEKGIGFGVVAMKPSMGNVIQVIIIMIIAKLISAQGHGIQGVAS